MSMQISFVNFKPTESADHMPVSWEPVVFKNGDYGSSFFDHLLFKFQALGIFLLCQLLTFVAFVKSKTTKENFKVRNLRRLVRQRAESLSEARNILFLL